MSIDLNLINFEFNLTNMVERRCIIIYPIIQFHNPEAVTHTISR